MNWHPPPPRPAEVTRDGSMSTEWFESDGVKIEAWLFTPHGPTDVIVVMAPGLASTKDSLLEPFAWAFARAGFAALLFDFRTLGGSEGTPRHWIDPERQIADYHRAIEHVRSRFGRVVLWGSSFSGGEVAAIAARTPDHVDAVIAQVPFLKTAPHLQPHGGKLAWMVALTFLDLAAQGLGLPPVRVPAFGRPGEFVFCPSIECPPRDMRDLDDAHPIWRAFPPNLRGGWVNAMCARMLAEIDDFTPLDVVDKIECPSLFIGARDDDMIPVQYIQEGAERCPRGEFAQLDCSHFDVYLSPVLERNLALQVDFLRRVTDS